jgi:hypothetical protein
VKFGDESRKNLGELEEPLRRRLQALDEPVDWSSWTEVSQRSRSRGAWRRRLTALGAAAATLALVGVAATVMTVPRESETNTPSLSPPARTVLPRDDQGLIVLPRGQGGFCYRWTGVAGPCQPLRSLPLDVSWGEHELMGTVASQSIASIRLQFTDGSSTRLRISWAAAPVRAGFFIYRIPAGKTVAVVAGLHSGEAVRRVTWYSV